MAIDDPRVQALLEELLDSNATPEQVCADCPELLPVVRARWRDRSGRSRWGSRGRGQVGPLVGRLLLALADPQGHGASMTVDAVIQIHPGAPPTHTRGG